MKKLKNNKKKRTHKRVLWKCRCLKDCGELWGFKQLFKATAGADLTWMGSWLDSIEDKDYFTMFRSALFTTN